MKKMDRRSFLRGCGYATALLAGEAVSGKNPRTWAACGRKPAAAAAYSSIDGGEIDRASFDFYTDHKSRLVANGPDGAARQAVFEISVNPIAASRVPIHLSVAQVSGPENFKAVLNRDNIVLSDSGKEIECRILAPPEAPEKTEALFAVTGRRGQETQDIRLRVTVLTAAPHWQMGRSESQVADQPQKISFGGPVRYHLSLGNRGHATDRFAVTASEPPGWSTRFIDEKGRSIEALDVGPVSGMFQWEYPEDVWLEAAPGPHARKKHNVSINVRARSQATGFTDDLTVSAYYSEPMFSLNDLDGLDPRRHYVRPGAMTSYILHLHNTEYRDKTFRLKTTRVPPGWKATLPHESVTVKADSRLEIALTVTAPEGSPPGDNCVCTVTAETDEKATQSIVRLQAEVVDTPKIYMLVIDSLDYAYLNLNRNGDGPGRDGDWLCPNIRRHLKNGVSFSEARCGMPAATDMNHTTIVSGAMTGTLGAYWVSGYYAGVDDVGDIKVVRPSTDVLRYGPNGKTLPRVFDLYKKRHPEARSVMISNKPWVSHLHEDGEAVKWGITGSRFPVYASPPPPYVLGDPPSDTNPSDRRPIKPKELIVNGNPLELLPQVLSGDFHLLKAVFQDIGEYIGSKPGAFPDDRWIADTACQVIREEDPDVLYVNLAATDEAGHLYGAAWDPDEWQEAKGLLFGSHWVSKYSEQARREEILDVVREADIRFGQIVAEIESRGMSKHALIVFTADHSMVTEGYRNQGYSPLDIKDYLRSQGIIAPKHYGTAWALNHWAVVFDARDDTTREEIRRQLQGLAVNDPVEGRGFHPCIVLGDDGMKTGVDADNPFLPEKEKKITEPGELYSEYYIHHADDGIHWPEICVFFRRHYQAATPGDAMIRGVNGMGERVPLLAKTSNRLVGIHGSRLTTHVPLVFSGPGIQIDQQCERPARLHDILPTLCRLLDWDVPETSAGAVLKEVWAG